MHPETVYQIWVPADGVWSLWAKPVPFAQMARGGLAGPAAGELWSSLDVAWAPDPTDHALVVVDLPGSESVFTGLALARRGYRPVPAYNACSGPSEVIDQATII